MSRLNWVWRWQRGRLSSVSPAIHIFEGLKVCIQVTTPAQFGSALAARTTLSISSGPSTTGFQMSLQGSLESRYRTIFLECSSTVSRT